MNWKKSMAMFLVLAVVALGAAGCAGEEAADREVKLGVVNWAEGVAMTNLAKAVLEDELDASVEITVADVAPIFASVATGDYDAFMDVWLPITHESYLEEYGDEVVDLGLNFEGARIGLVVPSYVEIDSIDELNANAEDFGGEIVGIDAGAGIMKATDTAIAEYGMDNIELMASSGPMMTAALKKAVDEESPVVVTGWMPHWKFAKWDLKFLEDPKGVYGEVESIHTVARLGLADDMPQVASFLENFYMDSQQLGTLMGMIAENDDKEPVDVARMWMEDNMDVVEGWLE